MCLTHSDGKTYRNPKALFITNKDTVQSSFFFKGILILYKLTYWTQKEENIYWVLEQIIENADWHFMSCVECQLMVLCILSVIKWRYKIVLDHSGKDCLSGCKLPPSATKKE